MEAKPPELSSTSHQTANPASRSAPFLAPNPAPYPGPHPAPPPALVSVQSAAHPSTHSWADKVKVSCSSNRCALKKVEHVLTGEIPRVSVPKELTSASSNWDRCLVGYFSGPSMPFYAVRAIAKRVWGHLGLENTTASDGFFLFRFKDEANIHEVLHQGPWLFGGKAFITQQWDASFIFNRNSITKVPVWAKLHGLPLPLWNEDGLSFVTSIIGKPIASDKVTLEGSRLAFARVCVELDSTKPLIHSFDLDTCLSENPIRVRVEFEWKPKRCPKCSVFGHNCLTDNSKETKQNDSEQGRGKMKKGQYGPTSNVGVHVRNKQQAKVPVTVVPGNIQQPPLPAINPFPAILPNFSNSKNPDIASCSNTPIGDRPPISQKALSSHKPPCGPQEESTSVAFGNNSLKKGFLNTVRPVLGKKSLPSPKNKACHPQSEQPLTCVEECYSALWEDNNTDNLALVLSKLSDFENNIGPVYSDEDLPLNLACHRHASSQTNCGLNTEASLGSCNNFDPLILDSDTEFSEDSTEAMSEASYNYPHLCGKVVKARNKKGRKPNR